LYIGGGCITNKSSYVVHLDFHKKRNLCIHSHAEQIIHKYGNVVSKILNSSSTRV